MSNTKMKVRTPVGPLSWVTISGRGRPNYSGTGFTYQATIVLPKADCQDFIDSLDALYDSNSKGGSPRSMGYRPSLEDGTTTKEVKGRKGTSKVQLTEEETDYYRIQFSTNAVIDDGGKKKAKVISVYNAKGKKVSLGDQLVGNGSVGALAGTAAYYEAGGDDGVTLYLDAVQIAKLVPYEAEPDFGAVDGGDFEGDDEDTFQGFGDTANEQDDEDEEEEQPKTARPRL